MINPIVWLWEDNAGGLYIGRDGGPWYQVDGKPGKFDDDAWGYGSTDDMDFEFSLTDGKLASEPQAALVAKWDEGTITVLGTSLAGSAEAGIAARQYLGLEPEAAADGNAEGAKVTVIYFQNPEICDEQSYWVREEGEPAPTAEDTPDGWIGGSGLPIEYMVRGDKARADYWADQMRNELGIEGEWRWEYVNI